MATSKSEIEIPFYKNITVASNELFLRATINRNLEKLLRNDLYLAQKIDDYGTADEFSIQLYKDTRIYNKGDTILYPEYNEDGTEILAVYLLESISSDNTNKPSYEIVEGFIKDFKDSGWGDLNPFNTIYNSKDDLGISAFLEYAISNKFHLSHENDLTYHKFGEVSEDTLSTKLLLTDVSNIADHRDHLFYPYEISSFRSQNLSGMYKKWGNGIIEYDLTFSLDSGIQLEKIIDEDGGIKTVSSIKVNSLMPLSSESFNNDDYFLNANAYRIFNRSGFSERYYNSDGSYCTNLNNECNVYHGTIVFPIPFADENYMIFTSEFSKNSTGKSQSTNTITFLNRQKESITAVYVIPNYNNKSIEEVQLTNNKFQCQIIGRWN